MASTPTPDQIRQASYSLYKFFKEYECLGEEGTACIIGFDEGNPIKALRKHSTKLRIVQFERSPFLEEKISKIESTAGTGFEYHIAHLTQIQNYNTIFVPVRKGKRLVEEASFRLDDIKGGHPDLPVYEDQRARHLGNTAVSDIDDIYKPEKDLKQRIKDLSDMDVKNGVVEVCYIMQCLDSYKLRLEVLIIAEDLEFEMFEGAKNTIHRKKPTIMVPNQWPGIVEVHQFLEPQGYAAYSYDPKEHSLAALEPNSQATHIFYLHYTIFRPPPGQTITLL